MKSKMFDELLDTVREGGSILRGENPPSRRFQVCAAGVRSIRERTRLSQSEFARMIGVSVKTPENWEQARRTPTGTAAALLRIFASKPRLAMEAFHRVG
jgi:putative transcriptional regulator